MCEIHQKNNKKRSVFVAFAKKLTVFLALVETIGVEPMTSCMSSKRSNQLSYASEQKLVYHT